MSEAFTPTKISFSRPSGNGCDYIQMEFEDAVSGTILAQVRIKYAAFATAITGLSGVDCETRVLGMKYFGKKRETKTVFVPDIGGNWWENRSENSKKAVAPFEIDGWMARTGDYGNQHRYTKKKIEGPIEAAESGFNVIFFRYVDAETGEPVL